MSIQEIIRLTGSRTGNKDTALINLDGLNVQVRLIDARSVWGRVDVKVTPVSGSGERWINADRLREV